MDFVFTVTSTGHAQAEELLQWLRQDATVPPWSSQTVEGRDSVDLRIRGDIDTAARFAQSLIDWRNELARTTTMFVTVDASPTTKFSAFLPSDATDLELRARISQLVDDATHDGAPETVNLIEGPGSFGTPVQPVGHTSPGPVLDPDDDWARDAGES
ncbi:hypothetical protein [Streptomyces sp. NPDC052107]|uniref:hypothetical protein n=1 Tax=Streptomyces sp. NPDC052107 TaxID=3155632 RepID=UPI003438DB34